MSCGAGCDVAAGPLSLSRTMPFALPQGMRTMQLLSVLVPLAASSAPAIAQPCAAGDPSYVDAIEIIERLGGQALMNLPVAGTRDLTAVMRTGAPPLVRVGRHPGPAEGDATPTCRRAVLWTSRGDSIAVTWIRAVDSVGIVSQDAADATTALADMPRVVPHLTMASPRFTPRVDSLRRRALAEFPDVGRGATNVWVLIGVDGTVTLTRIASSTRVEDLDQAALDISRQAGFAPARDDQDRPVAAWYMIPVLWRR